VKRYEALGLARDHAIARTGAEYGIAPEKVRWCAEGAPAGPNARPNESGRDAHGSRSRSERRRRRAALRAPVATSAYTKMVALPERP
jgi:hypothetical protein